MKKKKRLAIYADFSAFRCHFAAVVIPIRSIVAGLSQNKYIVIESRHKVHPFLVDEITIGNGHDAMAVQAFLPPFKMVSRIFLVGQRNKSEIISPGLDYVYFAWFRAVLYRRSKMGR